MAKVIFFIRVSTTQQNTELQRPQLYQLAQQDGIQESDIIEVSEEGESASKLSWEDRKTIQRVMQIIETEEIKTIYAWEISRLARRMDVLHHFLNECVERKIQVKTFIDHFILLDENGKMSMQATLMSGLLGAMAQNESMMMKERQARDIAERIKTNRAYRNVPFGYSVDKKGNISINEEQAKIVRMIWEKYAEGNFGVGRLLEWCQERGFNTNFKNLKNMLKQTAYLGQKSRESKKFNVIFPRIIDDETAQKVKSYQNNDHRGAWKMKHQHIANRVVVCPKCGYRFVQFGAALVCPNSRQDRNKKCDYMHNVLCNDVDLICGTVAKREEFVYLNSKGDDVKKEQEKRKDDLSLLLKTKENKFKDIDKRKERIAEVYVENGDKVWYEKQMKKLREDEGNMKREIENIQVDIRKIDSFLENEQLNKEKFFSSTTTPMSDDIEYMTNLVNKHIHHIDIDFREDEGYMYYYVHPDLNISQPYIFKKRFRRVELFQWIEDEQEWMRLK